MQEMTSKERVLTALAHKEPDRIPFSAGLGLAPEVVGTMAGYGGFATGEAFADHFYAKSDLRHAEAEYVGRKDRCILLPGGGYRDAYGVERTPVHFALATYSEISHHPLAEAKTIADLDKHEMPRAEWWDVSGMVDQIRAFNADGNDHAIYVTNGNIFESSWYMRGFEQMLEDFYENPELAYEIMTRVTDYLIAYFTRILQATDGLVDMVFTADDLGGQEAPIVSPAMWERMMKPHHVRLNKVIHEFGAKVIYHSDGAIADLVPGLMDMGIDILEALQFDATGMDPADLKSKYGHKLCFHGGVSVQQTLPFGTPEQAREEVAMLKRVLGKDGGYIIAPSHAIQAGTPPENIVAFFDECFK